jgi:ABC-2 type transport system permease protein
LVQSQIAKTGMENHLNYTEGLKNFHEKQRLYFYPYIFENANGNTIDWTKQTVKTFTDSEKTNLLRVFLPYFIFISLFLILSQIKFRKLC